MTHCARSRGFAYFSLHQRLSSSVLLSVGCMSLRRATKASERMRRRARLAYRCVQEFFIIVFCITSAVLTDDRSQRLVGWSHDSPSCQRGRGDEEPGISRSHIVTSELSHNGQESSKFRGGDSWTGTRLGRAHEIRARDRGVNIWALVSGAGRHRCVCAYGTQCVTELSALRTTVP
jgi:hypothetical protein